MLRRILVGFDGSGDAREAIRTGTAMALAAGGDIAVVMIVSGSHGETEEDRAAAFEAETALLRVGAELELRPAADGGLPSSVQVVVSDRPAAALSDQLRERGFDLLVVGRHGRERTSHRGLGRMARELADTASFPMLLVCGGSDEG